MGRAVEYAGNVLFFGGIAIGFGLLARYFFGLSMTATKPGTSFLFWAILSGMISGAGLVTTGKELIAGAKKTIDHWK